MMRYDVRIASAAAVFVPHPDDRGSFVEDASLDTSVVLDPEQAAAYLRWLETGEGECPLSDDFG